MALLLLAGKEAKEQSGCAYNNIKNGVSWSLAKRLIKLGMLRRLAIAVEIQLYLAKCTGVLVKICN